MLRLTICVTATCDTCGDPGEDDNETILHWPDQAEAIHWLTKYAGWRSQPGGVLTCSTCTAKQDCTTYGHQWDPWRGCLCAGRIPDHPTNHGICTYEHRWCDRTGRTGRPRRCPR